jgi:hypothetical protein
MVERGGELEDTLEFEEDEMAKETREEPRVPLLWEEEGPVNDGEQRFAKRRCGACALFLRAPR